MKRIFFSVIAGFAISLSLLAGCNTPTSDRALTRGEILKVMVSYLKDKDYKVLIKEKDIDSIAIKEILNREDASLILVKFNVITNVSPLMTYPESIDVSSLKTFPESIGVLKNKKDGELYTFELKEWNHKYYHKKEE